MSESTKNGSRDLSLEPVFTVSEVAAWLKCDESFLYHNWRMLGGKKISRKMLRFPKSAIENFIKSR